MTGPHDNTADYAICLALKTACMASQGANLWVGAMGGWVRRGVAERRPVAGRGAQRGVPLPRPFSGAGPLLHRMRAVSPSLCASQTSEDFPALTCQAPAPRSHSHVLGLTPQV